MISKEEVKHIAKLARLGLSEEEVRKMQKELSPILDYFNLLKEVNSKKSTLSQKKKDLLPHQKIGSGGLVEIVTRKDLVKKQSPETINKLFKASPWKEKRYIKVKSVF